MASARPRRKVRQEPDAAALAAVAERLGPFEDEALAASLARLGALVRRDTSARKR